MLLALTKALDIELAKWVLPVAISWGWGLGQVTGIRRLHDSRRRHAI